MTDEGFLGLALVVVFLVAFFAFIFPQVANNVFASSSSSYVKPLVIGFMFVIPAIFVYVLVKTLWEKT